MHQSLRLVCQGCNNGWMGTLQERVKPILVPFIHGQWPDLTEEEQKTFAAWATMFTMVCEFADPNTLATPQDQRTGFRTTCTPPPGWIIWVGHLKGRLWRGTFNHFGWGAMNFVSADGVGAPTIREGLPHGAQSTAFCIGSLFFLVFSATRPELATIDPNFAERFGLERLWPLQGGILRAPNKVLSDLDADNASRALQPLPSYLVRRAWESI